MPPRRTKTATTAKKTSAGLEEATISTLVEPEVLNPLMVEYPLVDALSWHVRMSAAALKNPANGAPQAMEWLEDFKAKLKKVQQNPTCEEFILPPTSTRKRRLPPSAARRISTEKRPRLSPNMVVLQASAVKTFRKQLKNSANRTVNTSANRSLMSEAASSASKSGRPRRKAAVEASKRLTTNKPSELASNVKSTGGRRKKTTIINIPVDDDIVIIPVEEKERRQTRLREILDDAPRQPDSGRSWPAEPVSPVAQPSDETVNMTRMSQLGGPVTSTPNSDLTARQSFQTAIMGRSSSQRTGPSTECESTREPSSNGFVTAVSNSQIANTTKLQKTLVDEFAAEEEAEPNSVAPPMVEDAAEDVEMPEDFPPGDVSMTVFDVAEEVRSPKSEIRSHPVVTKTDVTPACSPSPPDNLLQNQQASVSFRDTKKTSLAPRATLQMKKSETFVVERLDHDMEIVAADPSPAVPLVEDLSAIDVVAFKRLSISVAAVVSENQLVRMTSSKTSTSSSGRSLALAGLTEENIATEFGSALAPRHSTSNTKSAEGNSVKNSLDVGTSQETEIAICEAPITTDVVATHEDSEWEAEEDELEYSRHSAVCPPSKAIRPKVRRLTKQAAKVKKLSVAPPVVRPRNVSQSSDRDKVSLSNIRSTSPAVSLSQSPTRHRDGSVNASAVKGEEAGRRREENVRQKVEEQKRKNEERLRKAQEKREELERQRQAKVLEQVSHTHAAEKHRLDQEAQKHVRQEQNRQRALDAEKRRQEENERLKKQAQERLMFSPQSSIKPSSSSVVRPLAKSQNSGLKGAGDSARVTPPKLPLASGASTSKGPSAAPTSKVYMKPGSKMQTPLPQVDVDGIKAAQKFIAGKAGSSLKSTTTLPVVPSLAALRTTASKEAESGLGRVDPPPRAKSPSMFSGKTVSKPEQEPKSSVVDGGNSRSFPKTMLAPQQTQITSAVERGISSQAAVRTGASAFPTVSEILGGASVSVSVTATVSAISSSASTLTVVSASGNTTFSLGNSDMESCSDSRKPFIPSSVSSFKPAVKIPPLPTVPSSKSGQNFGSVPISGAGGSVSSTAAWQMSGKPQAAATFGTGPTTDAQKAFPVAASHFTAPLPAKATSLKEAPVVAAIKGGANKPAPIQEIVSYGLDIEQDDDTDDEDRPKKEVPKWARKDHLSQLIRRQLTTELDLDQIFRGVRPNEKVNLAGIFKNPSSRYERRTSSQLWPSGVLPLGIHTPLGRPARVSDEKF